MKNLKADTKYFWKVRAMSSGGIGSWSLIWNFKTALSVSLVSPELIYPLDKSKDITTELDFLWKSVNNATSYKIQIALDSTFDTFVVNDFSNTISYNYKDLNNNTVYYWRVQSQSGNSISPWSSIRVFVTNVSNVLSIPKLLIPSNNSNLNSTKLTFVWNKVRNANSYDLTIAEDDKLILNKVVTPDIADTTFSKILNNKKTYFWAIVAKNQTSISQISPTFKFNVDEINSVDDFENKDIKINKNLDVLNIEVLDNSKQIEIYLYDLSGKELGVNILNNSQNKIELLLPKIELILLKVNYDKKTYFGKILNLK
ncbi:MAG: fibronectin type III domain-containing protein [Candidatus Kapabacteria bacterium]|nr:fibronectin type III domain-containing protein [Candidatus Kapabacteria bacterium]